MIDEVMKLSNNVDVNILSQILRNVHNNAVGILYTSTTPTEIPDGKIVVMDDGTAVPVLYIKTGIGRIAFVELTV